MQHQIMTVNCRISSLCNTLQLWCVSILSLHGSKIFDISVPNIILDGRLVGLLVGVAHVVYHLTYRPRRPKCWWIIDNSYHTLWRMFCRLFAVTTIILELTQSGHLFIETICTECFCPLFVTIKIVRELHSYCFLLLTGERREISQTQQFSFLQLISAFFE